MLDNGGDLPSPVSHITLYDNALLWPEYRLLLTAEAPNPHATSELASSPHSSQSPARSCWAKEYDPTSSFGTISFPAITKATRELHVYYLVT